MKAQNSELGTFDHSIKKKLNDDIKRFPVGR